jgi:hypothetical protein
MKKVLIFSLAFAFQMLFLFSFCFADGIFEKPKVGESGDQTINPLIFLFDKGNFNIAVGLRSTYFRLTDANQNMIGNLNRLEEEQNYSPIKPLIQINLSRYLAFEFGYDSFKAMALNQPDYDKNWSDGNLEWQNYMLAMQIRLPDFHPSIIPYFQWGVAYTKANFNAANWHRYGFPSPATYNSWVGQGNRVQDYTDYRRLITADDCWGPLFGLGVDYFFWKHLALNLDLRYLITQSKLTYQLADSRGVFSEQTGTFNMSSWIVGLGLKYYFF